MSIEVKKFGKMLGGDIAECYILDNGKGLKAEILNYGGIIKNLYVLDKDNNYQDIVLGRDTLAEYAENPEYLGALIGRNSNRIANARFKIGKQTYILNKNDGNNNLHGGFNGFDRKLWKVQILDFDNEPALILSLRSFNKEEGFPGDLDVMVTYTLTKDNGLKIQYTAAANKDTIVNLTNHSYFNLNGIDSNKNIYNLKLRLNSKFYTPNTSECLPNGEIRSVYDTPFDFTQEKYIGEDINSQTTEQIKMFGGYDHNFILEGDGFRNIGSLWCEENGINMDIFTDRPGVQLYTGNFIKEHLKGKNGQKHFKHGAVCLETQAFPNSTSYNHFPSTVLKKGEQFNSVTEYRFSIR